jgi:hypothetical protein
MENKTHRLFNITILITVVPAYIYFCSFNYEQGICNRYHIPSYLISPSITTVLIFATTIWSAIFSSLKILGISTPFFRQIEEENRKHLNSIRFLNGVVIVISVLIFFSYPLSWTVVLGLLAFAFFVNLITWGFPFVYLYQRKKPLAERIKGIQQTAGDSDLFSFALEALTNKERLFIFILVVIPFVCYFIGDGEALKQSHYQTIANRPNLVVLRKYDDVFICAGFDRKTKKINDSLILIKLNDNNDLILKNEFLGQLRKRN